MTANWTPTENELGLQPIATSSSTQNHPLGKTIRAYDSSTSGQGAGEFIYLLGVASTAVGSVVVYNTTTFQTTLMPLSQKLTGAGVAVAMSANGASAYGWYQTSGNAVVLKTATKFTPAAVDKTSNVYISGTAGRVMSTSTNGQQLLNMRAANLATVASATSTVNVMMDRPFMQGLIT